MIDLAQELLKLTQSMLEKAQAEQWQEVEAIQQQRSALIMQLESVSTSAESVSQDYKALRDVLESVQQLETACMTLAEESKRTLAHDHQRMKRGKAMKKAYGG